MSAIHLVSSFAVAIFLPLVSLAEAPPRFIQVFGACKKNVASDHFKVRMTAQALDKKSDVSAQKAQKVYEALISFAKEKYPQGLDLKTTEVSTQEEKEWQKNKSVFVGYRTRLGIEVETSDPKILSDVVGQAQATGVTEIGSFESSASPAVIELNRKLCMSEAAQDALRKAKALAEASQVKFVGLFEMREVANENPLVMNMAADSMSRKAGPSIEKGQTELVYTVDAKYLIQ